MVQVHADGGPSRGRGFHIIAPAYYKGYTDDIYVGSARLANAMVVGHGGVGLPRSTYLSKTIQVRKDTGAINMSNVPTITVETLNMRNSGDAAIAMSTTGRQKVAARPLRRHPALPRSLRADRAPVHPCRSADPATAGASIDG